MFKKGQSKPGLVFFEHSGDGKLRAMLTSSPAPPRETPNSFAAGGIVKAAGTGRFPMHWSVGKREARICRTPLSIGSLRSCREREKAE